MVRDQSRPGSLVQLRKEEVVLLFRGQEECWFGDRTGSVGAEDVQVLLGR